MDKVRCYSFVVLELIYKLYFVAYYGKSIFYNNQSDLPDLQNLSL